MRILFIGDVIGRPGRDVLAAELLPLREKLGIEFVIANGENAAGGFGLTRNVANELFATGVDVLTNGNHWLDQKEILGFIDEDDRVLRPLNYPKGTPGRGAGLYHTRGGARVLVINPMGRTFMDPLDDPFAAVDAELAACPLMEGADAIIVDMHAEASSEKMAMGHYLDGEVVAVVGTHTHVQTADDQILPKGTAYLTDIGMTGPLHSVIGVKKELAIEKFLTGMPRRFEVASGPSVFCAVLLELDARLGKALSIERLRIID
jgi:metallophosphoesterase (TIGR00282 family)